MNITRQETIKVLKEELLCIEDFKAGRKNNNVQFQVADYQQALQSAISDLELLDRVEKSGVEKFKDHPLLNRSFSLTEQHSFEKGFNEAIDLGNSRLVGKMIGIIQKIEKIKDDINAEIQRRFAYPNLGKRGCVKRLQELIDQLTEQ